MPPPLERVPNRISFLSHDVRSGESGLKLQEILSSTRACPGPCTRPLPSSTCRARWKWSNAVCREAGEQASILLALAGPGASALNSGALRFYRLPSFCLTDRFEPMPPAYLLGSFGLLASHRFQIHLAGLPIITLGGPVLQSPSEQNLNFSTGPSLCFLHGPQTRAQGYKALVFG